MCKIEKSQSTAAENSAKMNENIARVERFINQLPSKCISKEMFRLYKQRYDWLMTNGLSDIPFKKQVEVGNLMSKLHESINN